MSVKDAVHRLVHRHPGGIPALAARMAVNPRTLQNKVNPNQPGHHVYIEDAELMTAITNDPEIAQALAFACGHVCIPVLAAAGDGEIGSEIASVGKEFGDVMKATLDAIADGRVTARELATYDRQFHEFLAAAVKLRARLKDKIPAPPPELKVAK
jgi:hypothetical protein